MHVFTQLHDVVGLEIKDHLGLPRRRRALLPETISLTTALRLAPIRQLLRLLLLVVIELDAVLDGIVLGHQCFIFNLARVPHDLARHTRQVVLRRACLHAEAPLVLRVLEVDRREAEGSGPLWILSRYDPRCHTRHRPLEAPVILW